LTRIAGELVCLGVLGSGRPVVLGCKRFPQQARKLLAATVRICSISAALGPDPISSRGRPDRRVASKERVEERSFSMSPLL
jgi:hypothetical protein